MKKPLKIISSLGFGLFTLIFAMQVQAQGKVRPECIQQCNQTKCKTNCHGDNACYTNCTNGWRSDTDCANRCYDLSRIQGIELH